MEKKFALIGKTLKHSYSPKIHSSLVGYNYGLVELNEDKLQDFVLSKEYAGYNVTIPYKKEVIKYLDSYNIKKAGDKTVITNYLRHKLKDYIFKKTKKNPMILPVITEV